MKKLIAVVAIFGALNAVAGMRSHNDSLTVKSTVSEADLVLKAEALIPGIINFTNEDVRREARYEGCWPLKPRYISMGSMTVKKFYKSNDGVTLEPYWMGSISYTVKNCRDND